MIDAVLDVAVDADDGSDELLTDRCQVCGRVVDGWLTADWCAVCARRLALATRLDRDAALLERAAVRTSSRLLQAARAIAASRLAADAATLRRPFLPRRWRGDRPSSGGPS